jgi:hypothetical protein
MADTLKRLAGPVALAAAAGTVYTVPALTGTVLRGLRVVNETGSAATFTLSIGTDGAGKRVWYSQQVAPGDGYDWTGNIPMVAAEIVQAYASAATTLTVVLSGVETI